MPGGSHDYWPGRFFLDGGPRLIDSAADVEVFHFQKQASF